jgi:hypothetical protein
MLWRVSGHFRHGNNLYGLKGTLMLDTTSDLLKSFRAAILYGAKMLHIEIVLQALASQTIDLMSNLAEQRMQIQL